MWKKSGENEFPLKSREKNHDGLFYQSLKDGEEEE